MNPSSISVIVVSYNTRDKLRRCLTAIEPAHEVIVVDNGSTDGSQEMVRGEFPRVHLDEAGSNLGFGSANNRGLLSASRKIALFLNSDAYAGPGAIQELADQLLQSDFVALGGKLLNADGSVQESTANRLTLWAVVCEQLLLEKFFKRSSIFSPYWTTNRILQNFNPGNGPVPTDQVMGACLMTQKINGQWPEQFDERYFLYCEDTDLCLRLRRHGKIGYWPMAEFTHDLGSSSANRRWLAVARYNRGKVLYFSIHQGVLAATVCWLLNKLGAVMRMLYWCLRAAVRLGTDSYTTEQCKLFFRVLTH